MPNSQLFSGLEGFLCPAFKPQNRGTCVCLSSSSKRVMDSALVQEQHFLSLFLAFMLYQNDCFTMKKGHTVIGVFSAALPGVQLDH